MYTFYARSFETTTWTYFHSVRLKLCVERKREKTKKTFNALESLDFDGYIITVITITIISVRCVDCYYRVCDPAVLVLQHALEKARRVIAATAISLRISIVNHNVRVSAAHCIVITLGPDCGTMDREISNYRRVDVDGDALTDRVK